MYCKRCGHEIKDGEKYCPLCGEPVQEDLSQYRVYDEQGNEIYGNGNNNYGGMPNNRDTGSIWWGFLGLFIPLAGIILYFCWRKSKPKTAKILLVCAIVGFVFNLISNFILINLIEPNLNPGDPTVPGIPDVPNIPGQF